MALRKQTYEAASVAALSTSNPATSGADTAFDVVTIDGSAAANVISSTSLYGTKCLECTQTTTASSNAYGRWNTSSTVVGSVRFSFDCVSAVPTSGNQVLWRGVDNAGARWATVQITAAGKLQFVISSSDTVVYTSPSALSPDTKYGVQIQWSDFGSGTTDLNFQWYTDDFTTPVDSGYTTTTGATGTGTSVAHVRFGRTTGTVTNTIRFDAVAYDDTTSTPIGPVNGINYSKTITEAVGIDDTTSPQGLDRSSTVTESIGVTDTTASTTLATTISDLVSIDDDITATMVASPPLAITAIPLVDDNPAPRVDLIVSPMPPEAVTVTIWRNWSGRRRVVRGASNTPVAGDYAATDYDAPPGEPITYTVQSFDAAGTPSQYVASSNVVTLDTAEVWLSDPLDPSSAVPVGLTSDSARGAKLRTASFRDITRPLNVSTAAVFGSDEPLAFGDVRQAPTGIPLEIVAEDPNTAAQLRDLIRQAFPLCVRTPADVPQLPGVTYLSVPAATESYRTDGSSIFTLAGDSVAPPGAAVAIPAHTFDDLLDETSSFDGLQALYDTFVDVLRGHVTGA